ncbi:MAG: hypothetical protein K2P04_07760 [Oscillospiraceae bacterium]|nr:hypothetical protein [Oscillospiraceae bacterium]
MTEQELKFNKKDTYTYDEVRRMIEDAMMDRARYLGFFYKVMPRELFDEYGKKALFAYGEFKAKNPMFEGCQMGSPKVMADFLVSTNGVSATPAIGISCLEQDGDHALLLMDGKCALVQGWEQMGLSQQEVAYLCEIASYGDFGHCSSLGLKGKWLCTSTEPGCTYCKFLVEKDNA